MMVSKTAMVMAAGMGKRMRPLTATRPKPLVHLAGKPLIDHCFDKLWDAGICNVVVNVHYLADSLEAHLEGLSYPMDIRISDEREQLLETGGGLIKALPLIEDDPFFCLNSDNIWLDGPQNVFAQLSAHWDADRMDALLLLVPHQRACNYKGQGDFLLGSDGRLARRVPRKVAPFVFSGIQLMSKKLIADPPQDKFSTNIFWDRAIAEGRLHGVVHQSFWFDVGTPAALKPTEEFLRGG